MMIQTPRLSSLAEQRGTTASEFDTDIFQGDKSVCNMTNLRIPLNYVVSQRISVR
jgi:hypothetical protein